MFEMRPHDGKYFGERNLWRIHVASSWTCLQKLVANLSPKSQFQIRDVAAAEPWAGFAAFKTAGRPLLGCVAGGSHERVLKLRFLSAANWCWCDACLALCFTVMSHELCFLTANQVFITQPMWFHFFGIEPKDGPDSKWSPKSLDVSWRWRCGRSWAARDGIVPVPCRFFKRYL